MIEKCHRFRRIERVFWLLFLRFFIFAAVVLRQIQYVHVLVLPVLY